MAGDVDILVIGAGVSGIGIACRLSDAFPDKRLAILEGRDGALWAGTSGAPQRSGIT